MSNNLRGLAIKTNTWLKRHPKSAVVIPYLAVPIIILGGTYTLEPEGTEGLLQMLVSDLFGNS